MRDRARCYATTKAPVKSYTRKTSAHSKRVEIHFHSVSLFFFYLNFCWAHSGLDGKTSAQAIGLADQKHDLDWIVGLIEERTPKPNRPKTYKKREVPVIPVEEIGVTRHVGSRRTKLNLRKVKPGVGTQRVPTMKRRPPI